MASLGGGSFRGRVTMQRVHAVVTGWSVGVDCDAIPALAVVLGFGRRQRETVRRAQLAGVQKAPRHGGSPLLPLYSQPATGPSALAPAQRAGAQRLCAMAHLGPFITPALQTQFSP